MKLPSDDGGHIPISAVLQVLEELGVLAEQRADLIELSRGNRAVAIAQRPFCSHVQIELLARRFDFSVEEFYGRLRRCPRPC